ncbi:hypothetical protein OG753_04150 [Streptomyces sp. NBC_00029]|uniref:hypothetical protein n=1 Tax=Streptomyces sp. NBC_00029 TaxID=2903613 RepID=UPI0032477C73
MNTFTTEHTDATLRTPSWSLPVPLTGATCAVLHFGGVWTWWALLWAPLLVATVVCIAYEWRATARTHWRMGFGAWLLLTVAHLGCVAALALLLGK